MQRPSRRLALGLLLLLAWSATAGCFPEVPAPEVDSPTRPGERLWTLVAANPALAPEVLDELACRILLEALERDGRVRPVGSLALPGAAAVVLRSPVHISSIEVAADALSRVRLPDGTELPLLAVAGPTGRDAADALAPPAIAAALRAAPGPLAPGAAAGWRARHGWPLGQLRRQRFDQALRVTAAGRQRLAERLALLRQRLGTAVRQLPLAPVRLRLSARQPAAYLVWRCGRAAAGPACRAAAAAEPERIRCLTRDAMSDGERSLLGWPLGCESG